MTSMELHGDLQNVLYTNSKLPDEEKVLISRIKRGSVAQYRSTIQNSRMTNSRKEKQCNFTILEIRERWVTGATTLHTWLTTRQQVRESIKPSFTKGGRLYAGRLLVRDGAITSKTLIF